MDSPCSSCNHGWYFGNEQEQRSCQKECIESKKWLKSIKFNIKIPPIKLIKEG